MPLYALMLFEKESCDADEETPPAVLAAHAALPRRVQEIGGRVVAGLALHPSNLSTTLRAGRLIDGPSLEAGEALAGITIIDAPDLDYALEAAREVPVMDGAVEVRPLRGFGLEAAP
jgi:hypothetical protein